MKVVILFLVGWTYVLLKPLWNEKPKDSMEQLKTPTKIKRTAFKFAEPFLEAESMKMAMIDKELSRVKLTGKIEILPNESSVKFYHDMETKEYSWEDLAPKQSFVCKDCRIYRDATCEHRNGMTVDDVLESILHPYEDYTTSAVKGALANAVFDYVSDRAFHSNNALKEFAALPVHDPREIARLVFIHFRYDSAEFRNRKSPQFKQTPLMLAVRFDEQTVSNFIDRRGVNLNAKDCNQNTALHLAINCDKEKAALELIEGGADLNVKYCNQNTALHIVLNFSKEKIAQKLIKYGADLDAKDCNGSAALHIAARNGYEKLVCLMIEKSVKVNPKDCHKRTPLHFAAEGGHYDCCRALLLNGAKENAEDKAGKTPLMYASRCIPKDEDHSDDLKDVVWLLFKHGANTKIKDYDGRTAMFGANKKCIDAIKAHEEQNK